MFGDRLVIGGTLRCARGQLRGVVQDAPCQLEDMVGFMVGWPVRGCLPAAAQDLRANSAVVRGSNHGFGTVGLFPLHI